MRLLGWLATVLGIMGVVGCLVVAVGVWVVRPPITDKAHEIIAIGTDGLDRADELAVVAGERLTTVDSRLTTVIGTFDSVAGSPLVDTAVGNAIRDAVSGVVSGRTQTCARTYRASDNGSTRSPTWSRASTLSSRASPCLAS